MTPDVPAAPSTPVAGHPAGAQAHADAPVCWQLGPWQVWPARNLLIGPDGERVLEPRVMAALEQLLQAGEHTLGDERLMTGVWGAQVVSDASLYKVIAELRKALGDASKPYRYIERVSGKGYRLLLRGERHTDAGLAPAAEPPRASGSDHAAASTPANAGTATTVAAEGTAKPATEAANNSAEATASAIPATYVPAAPATPPLTTTPPTTALPPTTLPPTTNPAARAGRSRAYAALRTVLLLALALLVSVWVLTSGWRDALQEGDPAADPDPAGSPAVTASAPASPPELTASGSATTSPPTPDAGAPRQRLALLPLRAAPGLPEWWAPGFSDGLHQALATRAGLQLMRQPASARPAGDADETRDTDASALLNTLNTDALLDGHIAASGDTLRITLRYLQRRDGQLLRDSLTVSGRRDALPQLQADVQTALQRWWPAASPLTAMAASTDNAAWEAWLLGRWYWAQRTPASLDKAIAAFQQALRLDPQLALARVGLCDAFHFQYLYADARLDQALARCEPLLREALQLSPGLPQALASYGLLRSSQGDSAGARSFLDQALAAAPGDPNVWLWRSEVERAQGELGAALNSLRRAEQLDPLSAIIKRHLTYVLAQHGRLREARATLQEALRLEPGYAHRASDELETLPPTVARARAFLDWAGTRRSPFDEGAPERDLARRINMALLHITLGELAQAGALLNTPALQDSHHPYLLFARASLALAAGDMAGAEAQLRARMALQPDNPQLERPLFLLQTLKGERAAARRAFLQRFPQFSSVPDTLDLDAWPLIVSWLYVADEHERRQWAPLLRARQAELQGFDSASVGIALIQSGETAAGEAELARWLDAGGLPFPGEDFVMPEQHPVWQSLPPALRAQLARNRQAVRASASP